MKNQDDSSIFNVQSDAEFEALAKAYVQAAKNRKISMTQTINFIAQTWKASIVSQPLCSLSSIPQQIDPEIEAEFKKKIELMVDEYPEFIYSNGLKNNSEYRNYTITVISLIYRMYLEKERIQKTNLVRYIRSYFLDLNGNPEYCNLTTISCFVEHIFDVLYSLSFVTTSSTAIGLLKSVDISYRPTIYKGPKFPHQTLRKIDYLVEADKKLQEYKGKKAQTITNVIYLIWFIETFF